MSVEDCNDVSASRALQLEVNLAYLPVEALPTYVAPTTKLLHHQAGMAISEMGARESCMIC
jgi:hypothetical protein